jgi:hypothetical protein
MSNLKYCQGPACHKYTTKDRLKGPAGSKTYQTRRRSYLLFDEFCSQNCQHDWITKHAKNAIDHFGRTTEPKHLTEENAWKKDYDWDLDLNDSNRYFLVNEITKERRPLTEAQYRDSNYSINTGE